MFKHFDWLITQDKTSDWLIGKYQYFRCTAGEFPTGCVSQYEQFVVFLIKITFSIEFRFVCRQ